MRGRFPLLPFLPPLIMRSWSHMCTTLGKTAATAKIIFSKMDAVLTQHGIPWVNCVSLLLDNTAVNIRSQNSSSTRIRANYNVHGCPCQIFNLSSKAAATLANFVGFESAADVLYWFDKSTNRKAGLKELCIFCDTTYTCTKRLYVKYLLTG